MGPLILQSFVKLEVQYPTECFRNISMPLHEGYLGRNDQFETVVQSTEESNTTLSECDFDCTKRSETAITMAGWSGTQ